MDWSMGLVDDLFVKPVGLEMLFDGIAQRETPIKRSAVSRRKSELWKADFNLRNDVVSIQFHFVFVEEAGDVHGFVSQTSRVLPNPREREEPLTVQTVTEAFWCCRTGS